MSLLKKNKKEVEFNNITMTPRFSLDTVHVSKETDDEWIWVEGYKGTKEDLSTCYNFQYELNKRYEIDEEPEVCKRGFHFCLKLSDVFEYYNVEKSHRFFKVKALVRKSEYEKYGTYNPYSYSAKTYNKIAAKVIILLEELSVKEIIEEYYNKSNHERLDEKFDTMLIEKGYYPTWEACYVDRMVKAGYTQEFAEYLVKHSEQKTKLAVAIGNLPELSMDTKVKLILGKVHF